MSSSPSIRRPAKAARTPRPARVSRPPAAAPSAPRRGKRPGPTPARHRPAAAADTSTRSLVFAAAADEFSTRGFDGVSVDAIARAARVNKAMLYYHFASKLGLYREIVRDMLRAVGEAVTAIADSDDPAATQDRALHRDAGQPEATPGRGSRR